MWWSLQCLGGNLDQGTLRMNPQLYVQLNTRRIKVVERKTIGQEESYMLQDGQYLCGLTKNPTDKFKKQKHHVADALKAGEGLDKATCKARLDRWIEADPGIEENGSPHENAHDIIVIMA